MALTAFPLAFVVLLFLLQVYILVTGSVVESKALDEGVSFFNNGKQNEDTDNDSKEDDDDDDGIKLGTAAIIGLSIGIIAIVIAVPSLLCFCCGCFCFKPKDPEIIGVTASAPTTLRKQGNKPGGGFNEERTASVRRESQASVVYPLDDMGKFYHNLGYEPPPRYSFSTGNSNGDDICNSTGNANENAAGVIPSAPTIIVTHDNKG